MTPGIPRVVIKRTVPMGSWALCRMEWSRRILISRLPPPRSTTQLGGDSGPRAAVAASLPRRDSSFAVMTSRRRPVACLTRRTRVPLLWASREAEGKAFVDERFDIESGIGASDGQADGVGAGVDGGDVYRLGHELCYRQRWARAEEGVYLEARMPSCSPMRWLNCLLTAETLASPSSSMKALRLAMFSSSRLIMVW